MKKTILRTSPWAVRDIAHGKTFYFESYQEMIQWMKRGEEKVVPISSVDTEEQTKQER